MIGILRKPDSEEANLVCSCVGWGGRGSLPSTAIQGIEKLTTRKILQ